MLNLTEMLDGELTKLRNVVRFSNSTRIKDESVAEHSYFTAYYAMMLARALSVKEGVKIDMGKVLEAALLHDIDEAMSGDFVRHFKYMDADLKSHIETATEKLMQHAFEPMFMCDNTYLSQKLNHIWKTAKDVSTLEGDIVAFADFLSVLSYVMNEIDCGNLKLVRQLDDMQEYANSFYKRKFIAYEEVLSWMAHVRNILQRYNLIRS